MLRRYILRDRPRITDSSAHLEFFVSVKVGTLSGSEIIRPDVQIYEYAGGLGNFEGKDRLAFIVVFMWLALLRVQVDSLTQDV